MNNHPVISTDRSKVTVRVMKTNEEDDSKNRLRCVEFPD